MRISSRYSLVAAILGVLWLFIVTFSYYVVHKPFTGENALALADSLGNLFVVLLLLVIAGGLGRRLTQTFTFASGLEAVVLQAGLGFGILSIGTLALGMVGFINRLLFWGLALVGLILLRREVFSFVRDLLHVQLPFETRFERLLALFALVSLVIGFLFALTPPVAWDAQTYHLVEARTAIQQGRIAPPPDIVYFNFPSLVEMLFLTAMLLKGDIAAQLIHFTFMLLTLGAMFAFALRNLAARTAWLAIALLIAVPSILAVSTWAYVDIGLAFYTFASFYAVLIARERGERGWFVLAGAFSGLAMGVKYTAAIVPIALIFLILLSRNSRRWSFVVAFLGAAALVAAPWYLRNLVFTGNPVYPFVFGGKYWDAFRSEWFGRFGTGLAGSPLQIITAPWDAAILGQEGGLGYGATVGPLLLALVPLLLFLVPLARCHEDKPPLVRDMLIYTGFLYVSWIAGIAGSKLLLQTRLLFPAFPGLALLAAIALDHLDWLDLPQLSLQRFARLVILLVLGMTALSYLLTFAQSGASRYLAGDETRDMYLAHNLGPYGAVVDYVNRELPRDAHILALWEPRSYYFERQVQPDAILDEWTHLCSQYHDSNAIVAELHRAGYTHVLLYRGGLNYQLQSGYDPIPIMDVQILQTVLLQSAKQVYGRGSFEVVSHDSRPSLLGADAEPYAVYELVYPGH